MCIKSCLPALSLYLTVPPSLSLYLTVPPSLSFYLTVPPSLSLYLTVPPSLSLYLTVPPSLSLYLTVTNLPILSISDTEEIFRATLRCETWLDKVGPPSIRFISPPGPPPLPLANNGCECLAK